VPWPAPISGNRPGRGGLGAGEGSGAGGGEGGGATAEAEARRRLEARHRGRRCELNGERREEGGAARPICALGPCLPSAGPMGHSATFIYFFCCKPFVLTAFKKHFLNLCRVPHLLALGKGTRYFMCFLTLFSSKTQFFPDEVPKILVKFT